MKEREFSLGGFTVRVLPDGTVSVSSEGWEIRYSKNVAMGSFILYLLENPDELVDGARSRDLAHMLVTHRFALTTIIDSEIDAFAKEYLVRKVGSADAPEEDGSGEEFMDEVLSVEKASSEVDRVLEN